MDKTIALIVSASVIMVGAVVIISIFSSSTGDFTDSVDQQESQKCDFQVERWKDSDQVTEDDLSPECRNSDSVEESMTEFYANIG